MTAITLNLLAEEQQAREERAQDPLKLFVAIGVAVITVFAAGGAVLSLLASRKGAELQALETRWNSMGGVGEAESEFHKTRALAEEITAANRHRAMVAPQLALVKDLIPATVRLTQIQWTLVVETTGGDAAEAPADGKRTARPHNVERLTLRLEGSAISSRPELEVDQLLKKLRTDERFGAVVEDIQLRSIARSAVSTKVDGAAQPAAAFVIECRYKPKEQK